MRGRYEYCAKAIWPILRYRDKSNEDGYKSVRKIKRKWGIRQYHMGLIFTYLGKKSYIIIEALNETDFSVISTKMMQYCEEHEVVWCWAGVLTFLNRVDELDTFVYDTYRRARLFNDVKYDNISFN